MQARALAAEPGPEAPLDDVVVGLEPQLVRRHRPRRVLVEQRGQRVHVVALERVDVPREQRLLVVVERLDRARRSTVRLGRQRRAGPLQRAVDRRDARCRAARRPRRPSSAAPRAGSARRAASAAGAGARRRTPAGSIRAAIATSAGSPPIGTTRSSGIGSIHASRAAARRAARRRSSRVAGPSAGRGAGGAPSMSRQTLVAMRYSHERSAARPSNRS